MMKECQEILDDEIIKLLLNKNDILFVKYEKFKINRMVIANKDIMKFCPEINCGSYAKREDEITKFVECLRGHQFCFNCTKGWHGIKDCEEVLDEDFEKWKNGKYIKQCPNCKYWTEKNEGCNHMTCRACNSEWCWLCTKIYQYNHYARNGPCYGLQFSNKYLFNYI